MLRALWKVLWKRDDVSQTEAFNRQFDWWSTVNRKDVQVMLQDQQYDDLIRAAAASAWNAGVEYGKKAK